MAPAISIFCAAPVYKMQLLMTLFVAALFFVLTPGILLTLPKGGSKVMVALTHALVFAVVFGLVNKAVWKFLYEGYDNPPNPKFPKVDPAKTASPPMM